MTAPTTRDGRTFDWSPRFDPRSLEFRAAPGATEMPTTGVVWSVGPVLDQGREGACVGMGCAGAVAAAPSSRSGVTASYALSWYRRAQRLDQWQGEAYSGTSVLAGWKVGRERRLWSGARWAKNPAELATGLQDPDLGPAIVGVQWSEALYDVPASGLLSGDVDLDPDMGHCVLLFGYVPAREHRTDELLQDLAELGLQEAVDQLDEPGFPLLNSWGRGWGAGGLAVAPLSLVRRWFAARGEFALVTERAPRRGRKVAAVAEQEQAEQAERRTTTEHLRAGDVQERDRILDPPEELGRESVTVLRSPQYVSGRRVRIATTAGTFTISAGHPLTVRRPHP